MTYRERRERRAARRREWQESRARKKDAAEREFSQRMEELPPMGEPIKVGHHSERRHRRAFERVDRAIEKVSEHDKMEQRHRQAASAIESELDRSIYDDDEDAIEQLRDRIAALELERVRMKAINGWYTERLRGGPVKRRRLPFDATPEAVEAAKAALAESREALELNEKEWKDVLLALQINQVIGYPPYALANLGGNISRQRQRLTRLEREASS